MSKQATMSIAEDFIIKGVRKLARDGFITDDQRKEIKSAVFKAAKQREGVAEDIKLGYNSNSDAEDYLLMYDKESGEPVMQGDVQPVAAPREEVEG